MSASDESKQRCHEIAGLVEHAAQDLQRAADRLQEPGMDYCLEPASQLVSHLGAAEAAAAKIHASIRALEVRAAGGPNTANGRATLETQPLQACAPSGAPHTPEALAEAVRAIEDVAPNAATGGQASL